MDSLTIASHLLPALIPPALPPTRPIVRLALRVLGVELGFALSRTGVLLLIRVGDWRCRLSRGVVE